MDYPLDYLEYMSGVLQDEYNDFRQSLDENSVAGLRVNVNKINVVDFIKIAPFPLRRIPFVDDGFYINTDDGWSKHPYYYAGLYYLQEPSAMLPANRLPVDPDDCVLDICAAPGGKSTKLLTKNPRVLVSNDISYSRTIPLVKNIELFGGTNILVSSEDPCKLSKYYSECFDKILVDAPCSGEGMFRKDPLLIKEYVKKGPSDYVEVQASILDECIKMLKPGGMLMFSTCTFSEKEDEENVIRLLENHPEMQMSVIDEYEGFAKCYSHYRKDHPEVENCIHIFPHKVEGEGHFLALLKKSDSCSDISTCGYVLRNDKTQNRGKKSKVCVDFQALQEDIQSFLIGFKGGAFEIIKSSKYMIAESGMVFLITQAVENMMINNIRYVRTGLCVGSIGKNNKFTPATSFALAFAMNDFDNCINYPCDNINVYKYLKGETIIDDEIVCKKGIVLICVDGYPLGYGKFDGSKIKNLYEKGWRMN